MKYTATALLLAAALLFLTACTTEIKTPPTSPTSHDYEEITFKRYGHYAVQGVNTVLLEVTPETSTTTFSGYINGNYTEQVYVQNIREAEYTALTRALTNTGFPNATSPQTGNQMVADVGNMNITVKTPSDTKTVKYAPWTLSSFQGMQAVSEIYYSLLADYEPPQQPRPTPEIEEELKILYQPMQCVEQPWETWYENSSVRYIDEPTEEQLIIAYYGSEGYEISDVQRVQSGRMVCAACAVCPTSNYFTATVQGNEVPANWTRYDSSDTVAEQI